MKKLIRYTLAISLLLFFLPQCVMACWHAYHQPSCYYMFRAYDESEDFNNLCEYNIEGKNNIREWKKLCGGNIPEKDIYDIVYSMPLSDYISFLQAKEYRGNNKFAQWIKLHDKETADYLLLAKCNERVRENYNSRWYYPTMNFNAPMSLEEIVEKSMANKSERLHTRYMLQAIRALFTLGKYKECIDIWNKDLSHRPKDDIARKLSMGYVAGAELRTGGDKKKALELYIEAGDIYSMMHCADKEKIKDEVYELEFMFRYAPNSTMVIKKLQEVMHKIETNNDCSCQMYDIDSKKLYRLTFRCATDKRCNNPAIWYYAAAMLADMQGNSVRASNILALAEKSEGTDYVKESIKVMRIYLDAKTNAYTIGYEQHLFQQLQWIDKKIKDNFAADSFTCETIMGGMESGLSCYYWNDMMRRITLGVVYKRMLEAGKPVRALQVANMGCNLMTNMIADKCSLGKGRSDKEWNNWDYSNQFFELIDSVGINTVVAYHDRLSSNEAWDKFLNENGYTANDYICDIVGTHYLRRMEYDKAEQYLSRVSPSYNNHLNVEITTDPFVIKPVKIKDNQNFKRNFAKEMNRLEKSMKTPGKSDQKARDMMKYAIGLRNSFNRDWVLTHYYVGDKFYLMVGKKRQWHKSAQTRRALRRADMLINRACNAAENRELAAQMQYELCNYRTVATRYADTEKGKYVRGACDRLVDYHAGKQQAFNWGY